MKFKLLLVAMILLFFTTQTFAITDTNLIVYYNFSEGSGTTFIDRMNYDQNATASAGTIKWGTPFLTTYSAYFDTSNPAKYTLNMDSYTSRSWAFWINKKTNLTNQPLIISNEDGSYGFSQISTNGNGSIAECPAGRLCFSVGNGSGPRVAYSDANLPLNQWVFVVATAKNGGNVKLYVNGVLQSYSQTLTSFGNAGTTNVIGGPASGTTNALDGNIDEYSFWAKELSQEDINNLYNSGAGLTYPFTTTPNPQARLILNIYRKGTSDHLTGVTLDSNIAAWDFSNQTSPQTTSYVDQNTAYDLNFTRSGYDFNYSTGIADSNKTLTIYLTDSTAPSVGTAVINGFTSYSTIYIKGTGIVSATQSDAGSGTNTCEYSIDDGSNWLSADKNSSHCYKSLTITDQNYTFKFRAIDVAGNTGTGAASATYIGDSTAPTTTFSSFQVVGTTDTNITLTCNDGNGSGCKTINYNINNEGWIQAMDGNLIIWTYDEAFSYTNWDSGEPSTLSENCVQLSATGKWNDLTCSETTLYALCSRDANVEYHKSASTMNWADANVYCLNKGEGWALASIRNATEQTSAYAVGGTNSWINGRRLPDGSTSFKWKQIFQNMTTQVNNDIYSFLYSGAGDHNIQYFSSDNLNTNESIKTSYFTKTGYLNLKTFDENTGLAIAGNINFNGVDYNNVSSQEIDLNGLTSDEYTITFSKTGYGTRYYTLDLTEFTDLNINMLMLSTTQGFDMQFTVFQPDELTKYANARVNIYKPNMNNYTIGTYVTDAFGDMIVFTSLFDQNYLFNINDGENVYSPVALTIKFPLDEETSLAIPTNYKINITGAGAQDYNSVATDKVVYLLPNTIPTYRIKIQDVNENYFPRSYYKSYKGNPLTDTLQPYLISALTGLLTTIRTVSGTTNQPIPSVNVKIYKDLPIGRTLVEDITTDAKGEALAYTVTGDQYYFEIYYNGLLVRTDTILATSSVIYIRLDDLVYTAPTLGNINATINFYPSYSTLSLADKKLIQILNINDSNSTISITSVLIQVFNTDRNGVAGTSVKVYEKSVAYTDQNSITNTIDINALTQFLESTWYDTNGLLQISVTIITTDANYSTTFSYKPFTGFNPIYSIGFGSRSLFGCSSYYDSYGNPDPLIPCPNQLFIALFVAFILTAGLSFGLRFTSPAGLGLIFALIMGVFTYLTFVPIVLYGLLVAGLFVVIIVAKGRFN